MKAFLLFLITVVLGIAFSFMWALLLVEWAAGCGESYVDANGVRHQYECVFIPNNQEGK